VTMKLKVPNYIQRTGLESLFSMVLAAPKCRFHVPVKVTVLQVVERISWSQMMSMLSKMCGGQVLYVLANCQYVP
jgi:hypothetical protein